MTDLMFAIAFVAPFLMWIAWSRISGRPVLRVSCSTVVFLGYIAANHVGLAWLYFSGRGHFSIERFDPAVLIQLAVYSWIVTGAFIFADLMWATSPRPFEGGPARLTPPRGALFWIVVVAAVCLPVAIVRAMSDSPLMLLLNGDPVAANLARVEGVSSGDSFLGIKPQYLEIPFTVLEYGSVYLLAIALMTRRYRWLVPWAMLVMVYSLDSFSSLSKGFVLIPIMSVWFTWGLVRERGRLITAKMIPFFGGVTLVVAGFAAWVLGQSELSIFFPVERILLGNLIPQYFVVSAFNAENILLGASAPGWMSLGLHDQFLLDVFAWRGLMGGTEDLFYTAPSSFVAEGYANFLDLGVVFFSVVAFQGLAIVDHLIGKVRGDLTYCALLVFSCIHFSRLSRSGLVNFVVDYHFWGVLIFALWGARLAFVAGRSLGARDERLAAQGIE